MAWTIPTTPIDITSRFTADETWRTVDISSDVPVGTKQVWLRLRNPYDFGDRIGAVRATGDSWDGDSGNSIDIVSQGFVTMAVALDEDRQFEGCIHSVIQVKILAYCDTDTLFTAGVNKTVTATNTYQTFDYTSFPDGTELVYILVESLYTGGTSIALRPNGESYDFYRTMPHDSSKGAVVGINSSKEWQYKASAQPLCRGWLYGYVPNGKRISGTPPNKSPGTTGSYQTVTCSEVDDGAVAAIFQILNVGTSGGAYAQHPDSTESPTSDIRLLVGQMNWLLCGLNDSKQCEIYIDNSDLEFRLVGWIAGGTEGYTSPLPTFRPGG